VLFGAVREKKVIQIKVEAPSVDEARAEVIAQVPPGYELTDADPVMTKGAVSVIIEAKAAARGEVRTIEAETFDELRAKVPEGWELLHIRRD